MLRCVTLDPSSDVVVEADVAHHLPGFCRVGHLFLQYALSIARSADLTSVRAYNTTASPLYSSPVATRPTTIPTGIEQPWSLLLAQLSDRFPGRTLSADRLLSASEIFALLSSATQMAVVDIAQLPRAAADSSSPVPRFYDTRGISGVQTQSEGVD